MLIDNHAHMDFEQFEKDLDEVIKRAKENKVIFILNNGIDPKSNRKTKELSKKYDIIKPAYGFYPIEIENTSDEEIEKEIEWIRKNKPVAIGEVGLDGKYGKDFEKQEKYFRKFISLASELDIPIVIHGRFKEKRMIEILEEMKAKKVILHTFIGSVDLALKAEKLGYLFSIPTIVTYNEQVREIVKAISINSILTETDAPFLAPKPGDRNEPMNVRESIKEIAEIKGLDPIEVEKIIYMTYKRVF